MTGRSNAAAKPRRRRQGAPRERGPRDSRNLELTIAELVASGDGVAIQEIDGERRAVFVPGVIPGERVEADVDVSTRPARARLLRVLAPSASRVAPSCAHVERCGACDWMHVADEARVREHAAIVARALPAAFARAPAAVHVEAATQTLGYRTRSRVHVDASGGQSRASRGVAVGMFGRRTHEPVPVDRCVVLHPAIERARLELAKWLADARGRGEALLSLGAVGDARAPGARDAQSAVLELRFRGALPGTVFARLERAVSSGVLAGARVFDGDVTIPATIGDPTPWIRGADGQPLRLAPGGFSQASEEGNAKLATRVAELAAEVCPAGGKVLELYAGAGNLTVLLARERERELVAVEFDRDACTAARANLAARSLTAKVVEADAAAHVIPHGTKLVVLDPPRTGAKEVARALASKPVPAIVYVSCDPPTLGRDLTTLAEAGYVLRNLEAFELFPQTSHVETVAVLVRERRPREDAP